MARDEKLDLLRSIPLFARFGNREIERLSTLADEIALPVGRVLMRQGDRGEELFIVIEGTARIERDGRVLGECGAGDILGEIALVDGGPRTATVTLTSDARLLVVGRRDFHTVMDEFPELRLHVLETLAHRVRVAEPEVPH